MSKLIVLGLDGACWPLLEPWINSGDLPHLRSLRENALWGPLSSQLPPVTSPNWACYATGCNPAKLGVFWWEIVDRLNHTIRHPSSGDYQGRPLWAELAGSGKRVGVLNFPSGYPPSPIANGFFTAGGPGARDQGFAYPSAWEAELTKKFHYRVHPTPVLSSASSVEKALDEILSIMQSRFDVGFDLLDGGVDFLHITIFYINVLQHFCYQGRATREGWKLIDSNLGELIRRASSHGYNLFLMSDHGCAPVDTVFHVNTWLERLGHLRLQISPWSRRLTRLGIERRRLSSLSRRLGVTPFMRRILPASLYQTIPEREGTYQKEAKGSRIDWENSRALASGQGPVYLLRTAQEADYERLRNEIVDQLERLRHPKTGHPIVKRVFKRDELYSGPFLDLAPDLVFEQATGIHTSGGIGHSEVFARPRKWAAENVPEGLFLAWGPDIAGRNPSPGARIIDLAPTLLHLMGFPISRAIDGRVLGELFAPHSDAFKQAVRYQAPETPPPKKDTEEESEIENRLRAMGYLD